MPDLRPRIPPLSPKSHRALALIRLHGYVYEGEPKREGVVYSGPTTLIDGQPWINWQTAEALAARGVAELRGSGEEATVWA